MAAKPRPLRPEHFSARFSAPPLESCDFRQSGDRATDFGERTLTVQKCFWFSGASWYKIYKVHGSQSSHTLHNSTAGVCAYRTLSGSVCSTGRKEACK